MALTNDLHHFLYYIVPEEPQPNLYFHPYIGTYLIYLWGLWMIGHQVYVIYQRNGTTKSDPLYRKLIPFYEPILLFLFSIPYAATAYVVRFELVEYSAGLIFILVLCWELYILTGLIPVNTQYSTRKCSGGLRWLCRFFYQAARRLQHRKTRRRLRLLCWKP